MTWSEVERNDTHVKYSCVNCNGDTCFGVLNIGQPPSLLVPSDLMVRNEVELGKTGYKCRVLDSNGIALTLWVSPDGYEPKDQAPVAPVFPAGSCQCCGHKGGSFFGVSCASCFMKTRYQ